MVVAVLQPVDVHECQRIGGLAVPGGIGVAVQRGAVAHASQEIGIGVALKFLMTFSQFLDTVLELRQVAVVRVEFERVVVAVDGVCDGGGNGQVRADALKRFSKGVALHVLLGRFGIEDALGKLFCLDALVGDELP